VFSLIVEATGLEPANLLTARELERVSGCPSESREQI